MSNRRRVEWDETNLAENEEYQRTHPVTKHITEPKTPYVYVDDDVDDDENDGEMKWDPAVNAYVRMVKEKVLSDKSAAPVAPVSKSGRPMLAPGTVTGELEEQRHEREFKQLRRAVYADEGAKFKALLAKQHQEEEDEEDEEDEDDDENNEKEKPKTGPSSAPAKAPVKAAPTTSKLPPAPAKSALAPSKASAAVSAPAPAPSKPSTVKPVQAPAKAAPPTAGASKAEAPRVLESAAKKAPPPGLKTKATQPVPATKA